MIRDEEGTVLPNLDSALREARASARDVAKQAITERQRPSDLCIEIQDDVGRVMTSLSIGEILEHPRTPSFEDSCGGVTEDESFH